MLNRKLKNATITIAYVAFSALLTTNSQGNIDTPNVNDKIFLKIQATRKNDNFFEKHLFRKRIHGFSIFRNKFTFCAVYRLYNFLNTTGCRDEV